MEPALDKVPFRISTCFPDGPADNSPEVLAVAPGVDSFLALPDHGPCLAGGITTLDDASFTTKITVHSGANALAPLACVALLDTGSPQTFIRRDVLDSMLSVAASSVACERKCAPRSWGGLANLPLRKLRRASACASNFFESISPRAHSQYGPAW